MKRLFVIGLIGLGLFSLSRCCDNKGFLSQINRLYSYEDSLSSEWDARSVNSCFSEIVGKKGGLESLRQYIAKIDDKGQRYTSKINLYKFLIDFQNLKNRRKVLDEINFDKEKFEVLRVYLRTMNENKGDNRFKERVTKVINNVFGESSIDEKQIAVGQNVLSLLRGGEPYFLIDFLDSNKKNLDEETYKNITTFLTPINPSESFKKAMKQLNPQEITWNRLAVGRSDSKNKTSAFEKAVFEGHFEPQLLEISRYFWNYIPTQGS